MKKVCAQWVSHSLTIAQKQKRVETCQQLLRLYSSDPAEFFERLVTVLARDSRKETLVPGVEARWEPSSQGVATRTIRPEANGDCVLGSGGDPSVGLAAPQCDLRQ